MVRSNYTSGSPKDMPGRAVILLQPHDMRAREILFKPQDIAHLGPAPAVDRLVIIADAADVFMPTGEKTQPEVLGHVGILVFVHKDIAEPALVLIQDVRMVLENRNHMQQQIAEVTSIQIFQALLIGRVELYALMIKGAAVGHRHSIRRVGFVLPAINDPRQHPRRPAFFVDVRSHDQLFEQPDLIIRVQNGEVRFQPNQFRVSPQQLHADRVERAEPRHPLHCFTKEATDTVLHLSRGFVGEGDGQNLIRAGGTRHQKMRNAAGQRFGFAGPRPCQHQNRPL